MSFGNLDMQIQDVVSRNDLDDFDEELLEQVDSMRKHYRELQERFDWGQARGLLSLLGQLQAEFAGHYSGRKSDEYNDNISSILERLRSLSRDVQVKLESHHKPFSESEIRDSI